MMIVDESSNSHRLSRTLRGTRSNGHESAWESIRVGSGGYVISRNARAIASRDVNKLCCASVPVLLPSSSRTHDWHSSIHTEEMGLSDELVYCFYRLSTYGGRTRLTNRFVRCQNIFKNWFMLSVRLSSYGCTREVGRAREKRKSCTRRSRV